MPSPDVTRAMQALRAGRVAEADAACDAALRLTPNDSDALFLKGTIRLRGDDFADAVVWLEQAVKLKPQDAGYHMALSESYLGAGRRSAATSEMKQAVALLPARAPILFNVGLTLRKLGYLKEAIDVLRRALALDPNLPQAHQALSNALAARGDVEGAFTAAEEAHRRGWDAGTANTYAYSLMSKGRLDEAEQVFLAIVERNPDLPESYFNLSQLRRFEPGDPVFARFERLEREVAAHPPQAQSVMRYALGNVFDRLGDYDRAFRHYAAGAALRRQILTYDETAMLQRAARLKSVFSRERMRELAARDNKGSELPVFIVGMPRSGTSLAEQIVASHPEAYGAGELTAIPRLSRRLVVDNVEPDFSPRVLRDAADEYMADMRAVAPANARRVTDKRPDNFLHLGLVRALFPRAAIIHCVRDALDTCISCFFTAFEGGAAWSKDLSELGRFYRIYDDMMAHWRRALPVPPVDFDYEAMLVDFEPQARALVAASGLTWDDRCLRFHETERTVRTPSFRQVRQPIFTSSRRRWRNYEKHLAPLIDALGPLAKT